MEFASRASRKDPAEPDALRLPRLLSGGLERAWASGALAEPALDPDALAHRAVRLEGGRLDEGAWQTGFRLLADELRKQAGLNALGRTIAHGQLLKLLRQRVRGQALLRRHPEIAEVPLERPVIILGQMRSGTTRLHRLLACDPRFAYTRLHESLTPMPRSSAESVLSAAAVQTLLGRCNPMLRCIHPTSTFAAEEEFGLHAFSFHGAMFAAQWDVPGFSQWCENRPLEPVYDEFRRLLQTLRWRRRDGTDKIQLLKAPQFMEDLDAVLRAFPDARILWLHRNEKDVAASTASLVWNQRRVQSDKADPAAIGREWWRRMRRREQRTSAALRRHPAVPVLKIDYAGMNDDWRSRTEQIYAFLGLDLSPAVRQRMAKMARQTRHLGHRYSPRDFGLKDAVNDQECGERSP
jgi:hypothetical protein